MTKTANLDLPYISKSQANPYIAHNNLVYQYDSLGSAIVKDHLRTSPQFFQRGLAYIIPPSPIHAKWQGHDNEITVYDGSAWIFITPIEGIGPIFSQDQNEWVFWNGTAWVNAGVNSKWKSIDFAASEFDILVNTPTQGSEIFASNIKTDYWEFGNSILQGIYVPFSFDKQVETDGFHARIWYYTKDTDTGVIEFSVGQKDRADGELLTSASGTNSPVDTDSSSKTADNIYSVSADIGDFEGDSDSDMHWISVHRFLLSGDTFEHPVRFLHLEIQYRERSILLEDTF